MTTRRRLACFFLLATFAPEAQLGSLYSRLLIMLGMVEPFPGCLSLCCLLNLDRHTRQPLPCAPRKYPKHLPTCIPFPLFLLSTSTGLYVCKLLGSIVPFILVFFLRQHHGSLHHISPAWVYFLFRPFSLYSHLYSPLRFGCGFCCTRMDFCFSLQWGPFGNVTVACVTPRPLPQHHRDIDRPYASRAPHTGNFPDA